MMGLAMSLEQSKQVTEAVEKRKAAVAASLGMTREAFDQGSHTNVPSLSSGRPDAASPQPEDETTVDEEQVLAFIQGRERKIEALKDQVRTLKLDNSRLAVQLERSERKVEALRTGLANVRSELAAYKAAHPESTPTTPATTDAPGA